MTEPEKSGKMQSGRFQPGQSGNPAGRPLGARHKALQALDLLGRNVAEDIILSVIQAAKSGDMRAAEIILRRIWPEVKSRPVVLELPAIRDAGAVTEAMGRIIAAAAAGEITPDEANALASLVEHSRRAMGAGEEALIDPDPDV